MKKEKWSYKLLNAENFPSLSVTSDLNSAWSYMGKKEKPTSFSWRGQATLKQLNKISAMGTVITKDHWTKLHKLHYFW